MAKMMFEVGDRVRIGESSGPGHNEYVGLKGVILEVTSGVFQYEVKVGNGAHACYREDELTLIKPKAPKTIPARNLSGKHIGRVVTVTLKSGAEVKAELSMVGHGADDGGVTVVLKGVAPESAFARGDGFTIDPDSKVTLS